MYICSQTNTLARSISTPWPETSRLKKRCFESPLFLSRMPLKLLFLPFGSLYIFPFEALPYGGILVSPLEYV